MSVQTMYSTDGGVLIRIVVLAMFIVMIGLPASAQMVPEPGFELSLGAGLGGNPLYVGSDEIEIQPFPYIDFRYETPNLNFFVNNKHGAGLTITGNAHAPFSVSVGIHVGESRNTDEDDGEDLRLLRGTPEVESDYRLFAMIETPVPDGRLFAKFSYSPIETHYEETELLDMDYDGFLVNAGWEGQVPLNLQMTLDLQADVTWMNGEYAEAFHSVLLSMPNLERFDAKSGIRDVHASAALTYMMNARMGARVYGETLYLLDDASETPLTQDTWQPLAGFLIFYSF